jgi:hypothetical protein
MYSVILIINKDAFYVKNKCVLLAPFLLYRGLHFWATFVFERNTFFIWVLQMQTQSFYLDFTNAGLCLN